MAWMNSGGFLFPVNPIMNGLGDHYVNSCVPQTVGVGVKVPVTVRARVVVRQGVGVSQGQGNIVQVTAQQNLSVLVPVQQGVTNPVRQRQTINQTEEIPVSNIEPTNEALQQFVGQGINESVGTNILNPILDMGKAAQLLKELAKQTNDVLNVLGQEIAATNQTAAELAQEAVERAAGGIDEALQLAQKIKLGQIPSHVLQGALSKAGVFGQDAVEVFNKAVNPATSADELAAVLGRLGQPVTSAINSAATFASNSISASVCALG